MFLRLAGIHSGLRSIQHGWQSIPLCKERINPFRVDWPEVPIYSVWPGASARVREDALRGFSVRTIPRDVDPTCRSMDPFALRARPEEKGHGPIQPPQCHICQPYGAYGALECFGFTSIQRDLRSDGLRNRFWGPPEPGAAIQRFGQTPGAPEPCKNPWQMSCPI